MIRFRFSRRSRREVMAASEEATVRVLRRLPDFSISGQKKGITSCSCIFI
ncbi:hypothetical protein [Butyricimonas virosa]